MASPDNVRRDSVHRMVVCGVFLFSGRGGLCSAEARSARLVPERKDAAFSLKIHKSTGESIYTEERQKEECRERLTRDLIRQLDFAIF